MNTSTDLKIRGLLTVLRYSIICFLGVNTDL